MTILAIETSCDETSAAVVTSSYQTNTLVVKSNIIATSLAKHAQTGGIIPEIAAREQIKYILPVIEKALKQGCSFSLEKDKKDTPPIDAIAVTYGPGLIGSLLVGVETARTLSYFWNKPLIPVNHLYAHIYANFIHEISNLKSQISNNRLPKFPALALVVSGGHTDLVLMKDHKKFSVIGSTRDDAAGEAFDKIGRLLGLSYPAGPVIARFAEKGNPKAYRFPRPMHDSGDFDFSFSGLKTAVLREVRQTKKLNEQIVANLCASVQQAIVDILVRKTLDAAKKHEVKSILLGGGVAANEKLQTTLEQKAKDQRPKTTLFVPKKEYCTDNAAMIAAAAYFQKKEITWREVAADPELYYT